MSFIIPVDQAENQFAIGLGRTLAIITWDGSSDKVTKVQKVGEVDNNPDTIGNRLNDAKADPSGRLWLGTMGPEPENGHIDLNKGSLYSYGPEKVFKRHIAEVSISNGLAWSKDKFYYIDSPERKVFQFDFDIATGTISM